MASQMSSTCTSGRQGLPSRVAADPIGPPISGRARCGRRTKELVTRLRRGEIALIHHEDLDGAAARSLRERRPAAVINTAPFITGRYPNSGPGLLIETGIPLLEAEDLSLWEQVRDGDLLKVVGSTLRRSTEAFMRISRTAAPGWRRGFRTAPTSGGNPDRRPGPARNGAGSRHCPIAPR